MKDKYKFIGIFLCMFLCISCGSNNYEEKEKLFFRILSVYSFGEQKNVHISDLNRECLIINSENDLKNSNLPETLVDSISQENINFDTMSLLIKPSYIDYPPIKRDYNFYKTKNGDYVLNIDYTLAPDEIPMHLEYLCFLIDRVQKQAKIRCYTSY
ncbi:MAG: hypothetical protein PUI88_04370 [Prevotella sp.]|nr:hypothetical protein [Prevotella sp.]